MSEITEAQVIAGVKSYRARCLDHGIEWRTTEPMCCPACQDEYLEHATAPAARIEAPVLHDTVAPLKSDAELRALMTNAGIDVLREEMKGSGPNSVTSMTFDLSNQAAPLKADKP